MHISGSVDPIMLIWVSLELTFLPAELEHTLCEFLSKVMMSEEEQRPMLAMAVHRQHRCQWFKQ